MEKKDIINGREDWEDFTNTQRALYRFIEKWDNDVKLLGDTFEVNHEENKNVSDDGKIIREAEAYADGLSKANSNTAEPLYATDKTDREKISVTSDGDYITVGPFNWEFSGNLTHIAVMDDTGKEINNDYVSYKYYEGNNEKDYGRFENIKSCNDFYIKLNISEINKNYKLTKLSNIKGTIKQSVSSPNVYNVDIWFLKPAQSKQELILVQPNDVAGTPKDVETDFNPDYDIPLTRDLAIEKIDSRDKKIKLEGVGFVIKNKSTGKFVRKINGKITYIDYNYKDYETYKKDTNKNKPTEFCTDDKGKIEIKGLVAGDYVAYETKNPNYGYKQKDGSIEIKTGIITIPNEQIYVKLSGYVWRDMPSGKKTERNDLYDDQDNKAIQAIHANQTAGFNEIIVRLKDKRYPKKVLGETTTKERGLYKEIDGGEYVFKDVLIEDLANYYVEFEYDGLIWQSVALHRKEERGSKATDKEDREILDSNFASVNSTGGNEVAVKGEDSKTKYSIKYNKTKDYATSIKDSSDCTLQANTKDANYDISKQFSTGTIEIRNINLGLYERPQADLSLTQDLENVKLGVNGYWHIYNYAKRNLHDSGYDEKDENTWNVGVKYKNSYTGTYNRAIYESDLNYKTSDKQKELQVYLTYKIAITNESSYLTKANSIVDYFDNRYTLIGVGTGLDGENNITGTEDIIKEDPEEYKDIYQKCVINVDIPVIKSGESNYIYVQFKLGKDAVLDIINNRETLSNRAEINSYTVYKDGKGNTVAAVDRDSVPGNTEIEKITTYEDDTDSAPSIQLEVKGARKIKGTVFVDEPLDELIKNENIRQGNGIFDNGENTIAGVTVTLQDVNGNTAKIYNKDTKEWEDAIFTTQENGNFEFAGYIPGQYTITYKWGDKIYTVQNYKGTVYEYDRATINQNDMYWYKNKVDDRKTDAIDNYQTRRNIDNEMAQITNNTINDEIEKAYNDNESKITQTKMDSTTPAMEFGVEYDTTVTDGTKDRVEFIVRNVDFGIVERAGQQLDMTKRVSHFKITLANGQVLVDATVDEQGNLQDIHNYVTYMGPSETNGYYNKGYIKAEIDNELIEGATLEVEYEFKFINNSEKDYMTEEYYKYGIQGGDVVTLTPSGVVDYLDKNLVFDETKNIYTKWEQKTEDQLKNLNAEKFNELGGSNSRIILYTNSTEKQPIKPGETISAKLNVSKLLTTSSDLAFNNDAETVKIDKPEGSEQHKGSVIKYFPSAKAEEVEITPSTGDNRNYALPIVIGMTTLVILGVGVFAIKKYVIK